MACICLIKSILRKSRESTFFVRRTACQGAYFSRRADVSPADN